MSKPFVRKPGRSGDRARARRQDSAPAALTGWTHAVARSIARWRHALPDLDDCLHAPGDDARRISARMLNLPYLKS